MSRDLPARPNLEHLKKQARELLAELQAQNPDAQLADALHALARDYGYASWPKLKAYVESLPKESLFVGLWKADVARSTAHPASAFRMATIRFTIDGDMVTVAHTAVDANGREERMTNVVRADGVEHELVQGYTLTATWRTSRVLETVATKEGAVVGRGMYEVSPDGSTMTISSLDPASNADGWASEVKQVIVLERA
jgi:hypothetical protein